MRRSVFGKKDKMLVNMNDILIPARENVYGVGAFDVINLEMAKGVIMAAEKLQMPVILAQAEVLLENASIEEIADIVIPMAERASVPVCLHYDHGFTFENCLEAMMCGYTSVMYDCSVLPFEENIRNVAEIARIAHAFGVTVEAELGHVGQNEGDDVQADKTAFYTDPAEAKEYVERTGVDALAVAVGTAHGAYKFPPELDFERISVLKEAVPVPLVIHGGSGLSDSDFTEAIKCGISKINIFTDINAAQAEGLKKGLESGAKYMTELTQFAVDAVAAEAEKKIRLFSMM